MSMPSVRALSRIRPGGPHAHTCRTAHEYVPRRVSRSARDWPPAGRAMTRPALARRRQPLPDRCGTTEPTTLTVGLFGTFGFKENGLYDRVQEGLPEHHHQGGRRRAVGGLLDQAEDPAGLRQRPGDVQAIEIGFVADVVQNHADQFVNFNDVPERRCAQSPSSTTGSGNRPPPRRQDTVGLGTDIGPEAICYRPDLLDQAGMTTDPAELAKQVVDLGRLHRFGKQYEASRPSRRQRTSSTAPRASSPPLSTRATRPTTTPTAKPDVENSDGVKTPGATPPRRPRRRSPRGWRSSRTHGTRLSPAGRSPRSPAPPG